MQSRAITELRLQEALDRLLNNSPVNVKRSGKLTLNKINREAGLGNSYIHKFQDFVERIKPQIEEFNKTYKQTQSEIILDESSPDEVSRLKVQLKKEKRLKEQYRTERDEAKTIHKELEGLNSSLMFRLHELQEEARHRKVIELPNKGYVNSKVII